MGIEAIAAPNINLRKGVIGVLTGGGDVPGLNPALRAVTLRASRRRLPGSGN